MTDVLIVEDDPRWRALLHRPIADLNYSIRVVGSTAEARQALDQEEFKVAVLDIRLVEHEHDNVDGVRLMEEIDRAGLNTRVILITGHAEKSEHVVTAIEKKRPRVMALLNKSSLTPGGYCDLIRRAIAEASSSPPSGPGAV